MKNKISIIFIYFFFIFANSLSANEFIIESSEIKILEKGNITEAKKGVKIISNDGIEINSYELIFICLAAISGSIFSPFLKFKGGKSLSVTCGIWLAISSGVIGPLICLMMAFSHLIQKTHIWTILFGWIGILIWVLIFSFGLEYIVIFLINFILVMNKHRKELNQKIIFRNWINERKA